MTLLRANICLVKVGMRMVNAGYATQDCTWGSVGPRQSRERKTKHKLTAQNKASNNSISTYLSMKTIS
jgi:hypothetical protein